jgi:molybdopterin molybdotransferase
MDGFALGLGDRAELAPGSRFPVVGESLAGHPYPGRVPAGTAVRIMTGAVVPPGSDTVVPVEHTSGYEGTEVEVREGVRRGQNVRLMGSEVQPGQRLLARGTRIRAAEVGALAVLGRVQVTVASRPRVAILATGDEVVPVDREPLPHQVRESNSHALAAQVAECGGEPVRLGIAPDEEGPLRGLLARGLAEADVLVTIGGVSKGTHDLVHTTLTALGVQPVFHGIQLKPGKPTFFGLAQGPRARAVFALPGNPASCFTVFDLLVRPWLHRLCGALVHAGPELARAGGALPRANSREQAVPAQLGPDEHGALVARMLPVSPSGDPFALVPANGYALVPAGTAPAAGTLLPVTPFGATAGPR